MFDEWKSREFGTSAQPFPGHLGTRDEMPVRTLWQQSDGAKMSWVWTVLGPKCLYTAANA